MKKILEPKFGPKRPKSVLKPVFSSHFLKFGSLVFLEVAYNDSLQICLAFRRGKIHEKNFGGPNLWQRGQKRPKTRFFAIFSSLVHQFS